MLCHRKIFFDYLGKLIIQLDCFHIFSKPIKTIKLFFMKYLKFFRFLKAIVFIFIGNQSMQSQQQHQSILYSMWTTSKCCACGKCDYNGWTLSILRKKRFPIKADRHCLPCAIYMGMKKKQLFPGSHLFK